MITPFAPINARTLRAERRAQARRVLIDAACLALLALAAIALGDLILTAALNATATAAQAEALKGM